MYKIWLNSIGRNNILNLDVSSLSRPNVKHSKFNIRGFTCKPFVFAKFKNSNEISENK